MNRLPIQGCLNSIITVCGVAPCSNDAAQFGPQNFVIIALKSHSIPDAAESMLPLLNDDTTIVTSSNGLPYWFFDVDGIPYQGIRPPSVDP